MEDAPRDVTALTLPSSAVLVRLKQSEAASLSAWSRISSARSFPPNDATTLLHLSFFSLFLAKREITEEREGEEVEEEGRRGPERLTRITKAAKRNGFKRLMANRWTTRSRG